LLLFALLACDTLIHYRVRWRHAARTQAAMPPVAVKPAPKEA